MRVTGGASTTSRRPERMLTECRTVMAEGNRIWIDHGEYVYVRVYVRDWQGGLAGPIFGYNPQFWLNELFMAMSSHLATVSSLVCVGEQEVADLLAEFYPFESVRWFCNGSDPCAAAVKLARAMTSRDKILCHGYHGTASCYCAPPGEHGRPNLGPVIDMRRGTLQAERDAYVPLDWLQYPIPNMMEMAAVIVECPPVDGGKDAASAWLREIAATAHNHGALFVLDEVVTGFRYGPSGALGYYDLPVDLTDLLCLGKTIGNGFPVSALLGKQTVMDELTRGVHYSSTFNGYPLGLAAVYATLSQMKVEPPWFRLYAMGNRLKDTWNALDLPWRLMGHPTRPVLRPEGVEVERLDDLRRYMFKNGHLIVPHPWFVSTATTHEDIDSLIENVIRWKER